MTAPARPIEALSWLGRRGPAALAALVLIGLLTPPLGALLRPFVGEAVFALLTLAFMRVDVARLRAVVRQPLLPLLGVGWMMAATPLLTLAGLWALGVREASAALFLALLLQTATMPMMAAPSIVSMLGLDGALALVCLVLCGLAMPILAPAIVGLAGAPLDLAPLDLAIRLALTIAGSAALGLVLRAIAGAPRVLRCREPLDGLNVMILFVFVSAVMGEVGSSLLADPARVAGVAGIAFAANLALLATTWLAFRPAGADAALVIAILSSQRNLGLVLAVAGATLSEAVWLYIAISQLPIYLAPVMLKKIVAILRN